MAQETRDRFWSTIATARMSSEADVEHLLVVPMLEALDFSRDLLRSKVPVRFHEGRKGRSAEADLVAYSSPQHSLTTSLITVEAKAPDEPLTSAKEQAESYANWLKTPFYILTNGAVLELWQMRPFDEAHLVLSCTKDQLLSFRGDIERVLTRQAIIAYCESSKCKVLSVEQVDCLPYVQVARAQLDALPLHNIDRSVQFTTQPSRTLNASELAEEGSSCAISGAAGTGKTVLSFQLLRSGLRRLEEHATQRIPLRLHLPDVAATGLSIEAAAANELGRAVPAFSSSDSFRGLLARGHALLICDGLDRVASAEQRAKLTAEIRAIRRSYPATPVIVLAQYFSANEPLNLPHAELRLLSRDEMIAMAEKYLSLDSYEATLFVNHLPTALAPYCQIAMLYSLVLTQHLADQDLALDVSELLRTWSDRMLESHPSLEARARIVRAMRTLSPDLLKGAVAVELAVARLDAVGVPARTLDEAVTTRMIVSKGAYLDVAHEILASYYFAQTFSDHSDGALETLEEMVINKPLVAALAASECNDAAVRREIWKRLIARNLRGFVSVANLPDGRAKRRGTESQEFFGVLTDVTTIMIGSHLAPIQDLVFRELTGAPWSVGESIIASGRIEPDASEVSYGYAGSNRARSGDDRSLLRSLSRGRQLAVSNLHTPRALMVADIKRALLHLVKERELRGGLVHAQERLFGRLRWLSEEEDLTQTSLEVIRSRLSPLAGRSLGSRNVFQPLSVDSMLADIDRVGVDAGPACRWDEPGGDLEVSSGEPWWRGYSAARLQLLVQHQLQRTMDIYREVVESSFAPIVTDLQHYPQWPRLLYATIVIPKSNEHNVVVGTWWVPTESWGEGGLSVAVAEGDMFDDLRQTQENHYGQLRKLLDDMGRPSARMSLGGWSVLRRDALQGADTRALEEAYNMLAEDITFLFSEVRTLT